MDWQQSQKADMDQVERELYAILDRVAERSLKDAECLSFHLGLGHYQAPKSQKAIGQQGD